MRHHIQGIDCVTDFGFCVHPKIVCTNCSKKIVPKGNLRLLFPEEDSVNAAWTKKDDGSYPYKTKIYLGVFSRLLLGWLAS